MRLFKKAKPCCFPCEINNGVKNVMLKTTILYAVSVPVTWYILGFSPEFIGCLIATTIAYLCALWDAYKLKEALRKSQAIGAIYKHHADIMADDLTKLRKQINPGPDLSHIGSSEEIKSARMYYHGY
jgi:hypothetical protein